MDDNPQIILSPVELRVIGSLIEKEITTPEYCPLTLNALVAACNQKSNRDPVLSLTAGQVQGALDTLRGRKFVVQELALSERTPKYRQSWTNVAGLGDDERAVMAELILRGPQTLGELRGRCARMHEFDDLNQVQLTLDGLAEREDGALVMMLPRQAGFKERRYAQLLGGPIEIEEGAEPTASSAPSARSSSDKNAEAIEELRGEMESMRQELEALRQELKEFRRQFE